jgi:hypothetical protein
MSASRANQGLRMIQALRLFFRSGGRKRRSQSDGQARHARSDRERLRQENAKQGELPCLVALTGSPNQL